MAEEDQSRVPTTHLLETRKQKLEVEVRRGHRRSKVRVALEPHPRPIPGEQGLESGVEEGEMVSGMARGRDHLELARGERKPFPTPQRYDPGRGSGDDRSPERVGRGPPRPTGACDKARRVDEVRHPHLVSEKGRVRQRFRERSHASGVVEVDVGDEDAVHFRRGHTGLTKAIEQGFPAGRGPGFDEGPSVRAGEQVGGDEALGIPEVEVEELPSFAEFADFGVRHGITGQ